MGSSSYIIATLDRPSMRQIRDKRIEMQREWEATNNAPCQTFARRNYDVTKDCMTATIVCKSIIPAYFTWSEVTW